MDAIRGETVWTKVKGRLTGLGSATFEVVKALATAIAKEELGLQ